MVYGIFFHLIVQGKPYAEAQRQLGKKVYSVYWKTWQVWGKMNSHELIIQSTTFCSLYSLHHNALAIAVEEDEHNDMLFLKLLN